MYDRLRDAEFRLLGTVVYYQGKYCAVTSVKEVKGGKWKLILNNKKVVSPTNKQLKLRNIPTGYFMIEGEVFFLERKPVRKYRQGLRMDNCHMLVGNARHFYYYTKQEYKVGVNRNWVIFSPNFAANDNVLYYRNRLVGFIERGDVNKVHIANGMSFLKECIEDEVKL